MESFVTTFDTVVDEALFWLSDHAAFIFDGIRVILEGLYDGILWLLMLPPFWAMAIIAGLIGWRALGLGFGIGGAVALVACAAMGLWPETMQTLALVIAASVIALARGVPPPPGSDDRDFLARTSERVGGSNSSACSPRKAISAT